MMSDATEMKHAITVLSKEVKSLRAERQDLLRRLRDYEEQLSQGVKDAVPLSELGVLASGIMHDLHSGVGIIRNIVGFMLDDTDEGDPRYADLLKIARSCDYCELVVRDFAALGGSEILRPDQVNIEAIAREVFFLLERKLRNVTLVVDADPDVPTIMADEGQMRQVFMNLIKNAGEAMPDGGTLTVRTHREEAMLRIEVADTGHGIPPENLGRIFDIHFTTKERGYGIGLYIVRNIIGRYPGGTVSVKSEVGRGTAIILHLPIELGEE